MSRKLDLLMLDPEADGVDEQTDTDAHETFIRNWKDAAIHKYLINYYYWIYSNGAKSKRLYHSQDVAFLIIKRGKERRERERERQNLLFVGFRSNRF